MKRTIKLKLGMAVMISGIGTAISVLAADQEMPVYVRQLIKCHEAKFEFDDAVGQLNGHFMEPVVYARSGFVNADAKGTPSPTARLIAIRAPFKASAVTFIKDGSGTLWGCAVLNKE